MIILKKSLLFLFLISVLTGCSLNNSPSLTSYRPNKSAIELIHVAGFRNQLMYHYRLGNHHKFAKAIFSIALYNKGKKVDSISKPFDLNAIENKGRIVILYSNHSKDKKLANYRIAMGKSLETWISPSLKSVSSLSEHLSGGFETAFNPKVKIKANQPLTLAIQAFYLDGQTGPILSKKAFNDRALLNKIKQKNVVVIYTCTFTTN